MWAPVSGPPARGFEYFEHTADVGIRAWGPTLADAFAAAAEGVVANMIDAKEARVVGEAHLHMEADPPERLLHRFLEEVLFLVQTRGWIIARVSVTLSGAKLSATLEGETYDAARHGHMHEIKAITMHELAVRAGPPAEVSVIVDI